MLLLLLVMYVLLKNSSVLCLYFLTLPLSVNKFVREDGRTIELVAV
jgi:hypothetical protein